MLRGLHGLSLIRLFPPTRPREDRKRQRTGSDTSTSLSERKTLSPVGLSEDDSGKPEKVAGQSHKKIRGAAAKNRRDKEIREREEKREKERADAAGRRKGRAERRRGDGRFRSIL